MAAKLQMRGSSGGIIRGLNKIWGNVRDPTGAYVAANTAIPSSRKCLHSSVYEKNEDDGLHLNRVPEDVIQPESQKSWVPHPETGVFGPPEERNWRGGDHLSSDEKSGESVLEQQVWYRPLEDVEKQPYS